MTANKNNIGLRVLQMMQRGTGADSMRLTVVKLTNFFYPGFFYLGLVYIGIFCFSFFAAILLSDQAIAADDAAQLSLMDAEPVVVANPQKLANFGMERASQDARHVADWVVDSGDNRSMSFVIVDKLDAKVFVFNADGRLSGAAPALLGLASGDDAVPGIGSRKLLNIRPDERTTPAGRFVATLGRNLRGEEILWVDYRSSISMHSVITSNPKERRQQRLTTLTPLDNRISYGCINVPAPFYRHIVSPAFKGTSGIVYVLPEIRPVSEVFKSFYVVIDAAQ